jgi:type IV secretory pathway TraG/TraD family ATPase VirD4
MPDEVMRLNIEEAILFVRGHPPIPTKRVKYFEDRLFSGKYDNNPQYP